MMLDLLHRATVFAQAAPGANTNILATALSPVYGASAFRITVLLAVASVFKARISDGTTTYDARLNTGIALTAGTLYTFTFATRSAHTYNFQVEADGVIQLLLVEEVPGGVL